MRACDQAITGVQQRHAIDFFHAEKQILVRARIRQRCTIGDLWRLQEPVCNVFPVRGLHRRDGEAVASLQNPQFRQRRIFS